MKIKPLEFDPDPKSLDTWMHLMRIGMDSFQFLREAVQNSIESILRRGGPGKIQIRYSEPYLVNHGIYKMQIIDDGEGMTQEQSEILLSRLCKTSNKLGPHDNFGLGTKIGMLASSPAGLIFQSWTKGNPVGTHIRLVYDKDNHKWGLDLYENTENSENGFDWAHSKPIPPGSTLGDTDTKVQPSLIARAGHGTNVIILGHKLDQDTMEPPIHVRGQRYGMPIPRGRDDIGTDKWIAKYLNWRYIDLPDNVKVSVFNKNGRYIKVTGQRGFFDKRVSNTRTTLDQGTVPITTGVVHWWLLNRQYRTSPGSNSSTINSAWSGQYETLGHVGALFQNELYEAYSFHEGGRSRLQEFGIIMGAGQVVLYYEPDPTKIDVCPNINRNGLFVDGSHIDWEEVGAEFRKSMPRRLASFVSKRVRLSEEGKDYTSEVRRRVRKLHKFISVQRWRVVKNQEGGKETTQNTGKDPVPKPKKDTDKPLPKKGDLQIGHPSRRRSKEKGEVVRKPPKNETKRVIRQEFPKALWISRKAGTRIEGELEDRAATYLLPPDNFVKINSDFRVFASIIQSLINRFNKNEKWYDWFFNQLKPEVEVKLFSHICGVMAKLSDSPQWTRDDVAHACSEHALTGAIMDCEGLLDRTVRRCTVALKKKNALDEAEAKISN